MSGSSYFGFNTTQAKTLKELLANAGGDITPTPAGSGAVLVYDFDTGAIGYGIPFSWDQSTTSISLGGTSIGTSSISTPALTVYGTFTGSNINATTLSTSQTGQASAPQLNPSGLTTMESTFHVGVESGAGSISGIYFDGDGGTYVKVGNEQALRYEEDGYEERLISDRDIPNKKYVDDLIAALDARITALE